MSKWARKAKLLGIGAPEVLKSELPRFIEEASRAVEDLIFAFECEGVKVPQKPTLDEEGLSIVERLYRKCSRNLKDRELVERLMGLFLGEVAIALHGGRWVIYPGRYHVFNPFVIELAQGKRYVQPLLLCAGLAEKAQVQGARDGTALVSFVRDMEKRSTR
jgi:hypothetical protein